MNSEKRIGIIAMISGITRSRMKSVCMQISGNGTQFSFVRAEKHLPGFEKRLEYCRAEI